MYNVKVASLKCAKSINTFQQKEAKFEVTNYKVLIEMCSSPCKLFLFYYLLVQRTLLLCVERLAKSSYAQTIMTP